MSINDYVDTCEDVARVALVRAKALTCCQFHPEITIRVGNDDAERHAYALATNAMKQDGTIAYMREYVLTAIKCDLNEATDECPRCGGRD